MGAIWKAVDLSSYFNVVGITTDGTTYSTGYGLDNIIPGSGGSTLSGNLLGPNLAVSGQVFTFGTANTNNVVYCDGQTITLSGLQYSTLSILAFSVNGNSPAQTFLVHYSNSAGEDDFASFSDWATPQGYDGENLVFSMSYRNIADGTNQAGPFYVYQYDLPLDPNLTAVSITLPVNHSLMFLAMNEAVLTSSDNVLWVGADSLVLSDSDIVIEWPDLSPTENNLIATSGLEPTFRTGVLNSLPVVTFNGGNFLQTTINAPTNNYSVFALIRQSVTDTFTIALSWGSNGGGGVGTYWTGYIVNDTLPFNNHLIACSDSSNDNYSSAAEDNNWHLTVGLHSDGSMIGYDNGGIATPKNGNANSINRESGNYFSVGAYTDSSSYPWSGDIAEIMVFDGTVSNTELQNLQNYLYSKWGISVQVENGSGGALGGGDGFLQAVYNELGGSGALGTGDQIDNETIISTEDNFFLVTEDGFLLVVEGGGIGQIDTSFVIHNVVGAGGALGAGDGISGVNTHVAQTYNELGSGGAVGGGIGRLIYTAGLITQFITRCQNHEQKLLLCRKAYVPVITRCNQKLTDPQLQAICKKGDRHR